MQHHPKETLAERAESWRCADVIFGGFPCQDVSTAGRKSGISGERSGLWRWMVRAIRLVRPKFAVVENVAGLSNRGMGQVLGDLAEVGYDTEWDSLSACEFGAPHTRERVFIIANPAGVGQSAPGPRWKSVYPAKDAFREADRLVHAVQERSLPFVCRGHDGPPDQLDRLKALGNAVVPHQAYPVFAEVMWRNA